MRTPLTHTMTRRSALLGTGALLLGMDSLALAADTQFAEVWKDPSCGCCKDWVSHLQANGFKVKVHENGNDAMRKRLGVAQKYASCHTGLVGGYAIEGHVPVREIRRLLKEKPVAVGLSVPGMPVGAPGMDAAVYGARKDAFLVLLLARDGSATTFQDYPGNKT